MYACMYDVVWLQNDAGAENNGRVAGEAGEQQAGAGAGDDVAADDRDDDDADDEHDDDDNDNNDAGPGYC